MPGKVPDPFVSECQAKGKLLTSEMQNTSIPIYLATKFHLNKFIAHLLIWTELWNQEQQRIDGWFKSKGIKLSLSSNSLDEVFGSSSVE
jgi:hypothetical protein